MQSLIMQNEALEKDIKELEDKLKNILSSAKPKDWGKTLKKKKSRFSLFGKADPVTLNDNADPRPVKVVQLITQIHELLLDGEMDTAQRLVHENKNKLRNTHDGKNNFRAIDLKDSFGDTVLMKAVRAGKINIVKELLDRNCSTDIADNDGETALMMASKYGRLEIVRLLVARANKDARTKLTKKTALMLAAQNSHADVCKELLDNGADPNLEDIDGHTAMELAGSREVYKLIKKVSKKQTGGQFDDHDEDAEDEEDLTDLLGEEYDPYAMNQKKKDYSNDEQMKPLLDKKKELENKKQQLLNEIENAKLKRGPPDQWNKIKNLDSKDRMKILGGDNRPKKVADAIEHYHNLVLSGDQPGAIEEVERLLTDKKKKFSKDAADSFGETALMKAARLGYLEMVNLLIAYKCNIDLRDDDGYSALMKAAQFGRMDCAKKLLHEGADVNFATRRDKYTALMLAAQRGHGKMCEMLISEGANHQLMDSSGKKAVDLALNPDAKRMIEDAMQEHPIDENRVQI